MIFTNELLMKGAILVLGLCGFFIAKRIRNHKTQNAPLVCPIGFDCKAVVHSYYSKFCCVPVEFLGMMYYALISLLALFFILKGDFVEKSLIVGLLLFSLLISFIALLFSVYLILMQIFVIKKGCSWCILSSLISASIFIIIYEFGAKIIFH